MNTSTPPLLSFGSEGALTRPGPRPFHFTQLMATASAAAVRAFRKLRADWREHRRTRALRDTLNALDDRTLADIGLHRSDIAAVAWGVGEPTHAGRSVLRTRQP
jgi:uncharacterized protein YjiS (DUF1127 family)